MDSNNSGTLNRRGLKGITGMRRQRSLEWRQERGYSSSDEEITTRPVDTHVFASLLAQAQQEYSCKFFISFLDSLSLYLAYYEVSEFFLVHHG